jgi:hypothetical protein
MRAVGNCVSHCHQQHDVLRTAELGFFFRTVPEFIDPRFRENSPKTLVFSHRKRAFWACFRETEGKVFVINFRAQNND